MSSSQTTVSTRSSLESAGRVVAAISAVALLVLVVGRVAGWHGFQADDDGSATAGTTFAVFALTFLVTLVIAIVLAVKRRGRAALLLAGYLVVAVVVSVLESAGLFG